MMTKREMLSDYFVTLARQLNEFETIGYLFHEIREFTGVDLRAENEAIHNALESCRDKLKKARDEAES